MAKSIETEEAPEAIAYALLQHIAHGEDKIDSWGDILLIKADKEWILNTYKECLTAIKSAQ